MKLLRYGPAGREKPGLLDPGGTIRDLSGEIEDVAGIALFPDELARLAELDPARLPAVKGTPRLGPCVGQVGKIVCIGLNYADHAAEAGLALPGEPVLILKATSALCGPEDDVVLPRDSEKTDWGVELGVVIGTEASNVSETRAMGHVAGYCVVNDISERAFQFEHEGQWSKGNSADTFGPVGPWLVTRDEIPDPQSLSLFFELDGEVFQNGSTAAMVFGVAELVAYVSRFMRLQTGDILFTGTPPGVGMAQDPPVYLQPGNVMRLGIDGLGEQRHRVVAWRAR